MTMGTRADFYIGRGKKAEWLGSIAWDGYSIPKKLRQAATEAEFRERLAKFAKKRDDWTAPEDGWPWPWYDSHLTDEVWAFDDGKVWNANGSPARWFDANAEKPDFSETEDEDAAFEAWHTTLPAAVFPDMSKKKNVAYGKRSGLLIIGG
jgi:hypothetical protein